MIGRLLALGLVAALTVVPPGPASAGGRLLETVDSYALFSPNGDGRKDRLPVRFRLEEPARVTLVVLDRYEQPPVERRTVHLDLPAGRHTWKWNGRDDRGRPVPDGSYRIRLRANAEQHPARTGRAFSSALIDRGAGVAAARVWLSRDTVYPSTPGLEDRIWIRSTTGGIRTDLEIRDTDGDVVSRMRIHGWGSWAARDGAGALVPPGEYVARFTISDHYGNRRTTDRTFTVSDQALVQEVWTTTLQGADAELVWPDGYCPPTPSERIDGGMTLAVRDGCERSLFRPQLEVPFRLYPGASWRVSVTGGPTIPGEADRAVISLRDDYGGLEVQTGPGDGTTTTAWGQVTRTEWARPQDWVFWLVVGDPDTSYDVAEFTIEVRHWVAPGAEQRAGDPRSRPQFTRIG